MRKERRTRRGILAASLLCIGMLSGCLTAETETLPQDKALRDETAGTETLPEDGASRDETAEATFLQDAAQNMRENIDNFRERIAGGAERAETEAPETEGEDAGQDFGALHAGRYVYGTLTETEQRVYQEIYRALQQYEEEITVSTKDKRLLDRAYDAVYADYGELFWSSGYTYTEYTLAGNVRELKFAPKYMMGREEKERTQQQIDGVVQGILAQAPAGGTDYDRALYVYEYLIEHVEYDAGAADNQNIVSVFLNGRTVCEGYARASQYLLECLGIQSAVVGGMAKGDFHAWNLVRLDGAYYYMDTTWGDNADGTTQGGAETYINYTYFAVTTDELFRTHTPSQTIELPECTATQDNYYVKNGLYIAEGMEAASAALKAHYEAGDASVSLKFSTEALYHVAYTQWIDDSGIFDLCGGLTNLYYFEDRTMLVLTFLF